MVSTASFEVKNSDRLRLAAKPYERPPPPQADSAPAPAPRTDYFERLNIPQNVESNNSLSAVIDVVPDVRYPLLYIIFHVMKLYVSNEQQAHPLMTPASFTGYCLFLFYGFLLVNDYHGRNTPSYYASAFNDSDQRSKLFDALKHAFVPPFMITLFHGISDTSDPRRPGLKYFPTLAASRFMLDFGRLVPPQLFLAMHNLSAEQDTSRAATTAMQSLANTILFTIAPTTADAIRAGHYFGAGTSTGTHRNWMYTAISTLFSPVTGKSLLRRTNIEPVPFDAFRISLDQSTSNDVTHDNMYTIFLNAPRTLVNRTNTFISEFSNIIKVSYNGTFALGAVPDDLSGLSILTHGYSRFALPTWHTLAFQNDTVGHTPIDSSTYATALNFCQDITWNANTTLTRPTAPAGLMEFLYLVKSGTHNDDESPDHFDIFDPETDEYPNIHWLQPYTEGDQAISYSMISGLLIELMDFDGTSIPIPDVEQGLRLENGNFLQGSLPATHVMHGYNRIPRYDTIARTQTKKKIQKISFDLYDMSISRMPNFVAAVDDTTLPTALPGFTIQTQIKGFSKAFSKLSFSSATTPPTASKRYAVWSPYRHIFDEKDYIPSEAKIHLILVPRCLYGTGTVLLKTDHSAMLMPIS